MWGVSVAQTLILQRVLECSQNKLPDGQQVLLEKLISSGTAGAGKNE